MKQLLIGIDVGTTNVKTAVFDCHGREIALSRRNLLIQKNEMGHVEQDMDEIWRQVVETIREAVNAVSGLGTICGIGVTGQGDGLWMIDQKGTPIRNAVLWIDGRTRSMVMDWEREGISSASGRKVFPGSLSALAAWFYRHEPEVIAEARHIMVCKDWIKYRLTGEVVTDATDMSDASMIDVSKRDYQEDLFALYGLQSLGDRFPPLKESYAVIGAVTSEAAEITGLPMGVPVVNGMIDVAATALGAGVINLGEACSIAGTTIYNVIVLDEETQKKARQSGGAASVICHAHPESWLMSQGTMMGTPNLDWFLAEMYCGRDEKVDYKALEESAAGIPIGADGVMYLPFLGAGGERAPFTKDSASAGFFGLKNHHTRDHLLRAVYEGVALSMKDCYKNFSEKPKSLRLAGGGANSDFWTQIFADCLGIPVERCHGSEYGCRGAALTAGVGVGCFSSLEEGVKAMVSVKKTSVPESERVEIYEKLYDLYTSLYKDLWEAWERRKDFLSIFSKK